MKKIYFIILFAFTGVITNAQDCFWAKRAGTNQYEQGNGVTVDGNGNAYAIGSFNTNTIVFSPYTLTNHVPGNYDFFVVKYNKGGIVKWAKNYGTANANAITSDSNGNIYITGDYGASFLKFGNDTVFNSNPGNGSTFMVKLDSNGNVLWAKNNNKIIGTPGSIAVSPTAIAYDGNGKIYTTGYFLCNYIIFGNDTLFHTGTSGYDVFVAKYDTSGNSVWARGSKGGTNINEGLSIAADTGNVYVSGRYINPILVFGTDTLFGNGIDQVFTLKCDKSGNFKWVRSAISSGSYGFGITTDGNGNTYTTGFFSGGSQIIFGNDTLNTGSFFLVKYDAFGNAKWARSTNINESCKGLAITHDGSGNIYVAGEMAPIDTTRFGNVVLVNPSYFQNTYPVFIVKYDTLGNALSGICSTSTPVLPGGGRGLGIAVDASGKIFATGFITGTIKFGGISLTSAGGWDFFLMHTYPFSVNLVTTNVHCYGANDATATSIITGGAAPFIYQWDTGQTTPSITNLPAFLGVDTLKVTDANGCAEIKTYSISGPSAVQNNICLVTVDSMSQYNIITWDKTPFNDVDSFIVYREISTNNYQPIAVIPYGSLSQFVDTVRTKYFPNTGDPNSGTYRYKITVHDTCGTYRVKGPYHNTIYFLNNAGAFYWTQPYTIEGAANPVSSYVLLRDDNSTGSWHAVSSVAGTQQTISDPLYSIYQNTASWRVQTQWSITCTPTLKTGNNTASNFSSSYSNIYTNNPNAIKNNSSDIKLNIYPNPSNGKIILQYELKNQKASLEIYDIIGTKVYSQTDLPSNQTIIDLNAQAAGVYFLNFKTENGIVIKKIIIQ